MNIFKLDPSRTSLLRRKFVAEMRRRFYKIIIEMRKLVIEEDAFGLIPNSQFKILTANELSSNELQTLKDDPEGFWFTTEDGRHIFARKGESKGDAVKRVFGEEEKGKGKTLFHGTSLERAKKIKKEGLKVQRFNKDWTAYKETGERSKSVFVTDDKEFALGMGIIHTAFGKGVPAVVEIEIPESVKLHKDYAFPKDAYYHIGDIPSSWIKSIYVFNEATKKFEMVHNVYNVKKKRYYLVIRLLEPKKKETTDNLLVVNKQQWIFQTDAQKIQSFRRLLKQMIDGGILSVKPTTGKVWMADYVDSAFKKGILRAYIGVHSDALAKSPAWYMGTKEGFLRTAFGQPETMSKIELIYTRAYNDLVGVTDAMGQKMSRILAEGLAKGEGPYKIARTMSNSIKNLTRTRAELIARTETIYAHAEGQLDAYELLGVENVNAEVEWTTAGDGKVCDECASMEGQVYSIDEARGMIPLHPNCFIDGQVPIYTSKGWKQISDIQIGDLVLTHKKRFRRVIQLYKTPKQQSSVIALYLRGRKESYTTLTITENHPVLLNDRWVEAKNAKIGMIVSYLASKCKRCNKPIPFNKVYCSGRCCSLDITDKQWSSKKHRKIMSEKTTAQLNREYALGIRNGRTIIKEAHKVTKKMAKEGKCPLARPDVRNIIRLVTNTPEMKKQSSERMKLNNPMDDIMVRKKATKSYKQTLLLHPEKRLNARMAKLKNSGNMTWIEHRMSQLLDKLRIDYVFNYPILKYNVDFAIPALRIVIECDGEYWHRDKRKDLKRQHSIEKEGWFVLRYTGKQINQCLEEIRGELQRVFMNHNRQYDFMSRKLVAIKKWVLRKPRTLYNFSVEDDESYVAKGFVVHNCRCAWNPVMQKDVKKM